MLFNSPEFIVFLLIVYGLYLVLPFRPQNLLLLFASYIFYGWWDSRFLFLIVMSTVVDFWIGLMMENGRLTRQQRLVPSVYLVIFAIGLLGLNPSGQWSLANASFDTYKFVQIHSVAIAIGGALAFIVVAHVVFSILEKLEENRRRLVCVSISVTTQLGLLGFFKYFNFFVDSLHSALATIGINSATWHLEIVLPVGISFYTFQSLSYTIDIYRRQAKPTDRFFVFALFVAYFPQLQAGPIERARHLLPQFGNPRHLNLDQTARGLYLIALGFFKKVGIADGVAPVVDQIFNSSGRISWIDVVAGTVFFAVQIYCDFSGYTDIARGISKLLGIDLMVNFNQPYFSTNPQEFWRRWHISLSTWLRDYLYIPLGGNRGTLAFVCRNLMLTMVIGGLWHGAAWNYVLWGFYQGILLVIYHVWRTLKPEKSSFWESPLARLVLMGFFFVIVCYGWLLFRAQSFDQIVQFTTILVRDFGNLDYGASPPRLSAVLGIGLLVLIECAQYWTDNPRFYRHLVVPARGFLVASMIFVTFIGMSNEPAQFIYFQF